ncbi:hypothetical protein RZ760_010475 [Providencia rettgeri]|nr:hypothetical protein [Providencia rettgeri]
MNTINNNYNTSKSNIRNHQVGDFLYNNRKTIGLTAALVAIAPITLMLTYAGAGEIFAEMYDSCKIPKHKRATYSKVLKAVNEPIEKNTRNALKSQIAKLRTIPNNHPTRQAKYIDRLEKITDAYLTSKYKDDSIKSKYNILTNGKIELKVNSSSGSEKNKLMIDEVSQLILARRNK